MPLRLLSINLCLHADLSPEPTLLKAMSKVSWVYAMVGLLQLPFRK
jgi:hypothetical protein